MINKHRTCRQIRAEARAYCRKNIREVILTWLSFFVITACCCALSFLSPLTLILTIPFVIVPLFFSMQFVNSSFEDKEPLTNRLIWENFKNYFINYRGVYRLASSFLKGFLWWTAITFIVAFGFSIIGTSTWPALNEDLGTLEMMMQDLSTDITSIYNFCMNSEPICTVLVCVYAPATSFGVYAFLHSIGINSINAFLRNSVKPEAGRQSDILFSRCVRSHLLEIYKDYYGSNFIMTILFALGVGVGLLVFFLTGLNVAYIISFIFSGAILFVSFGLSFFFKSNELVFQNNSRMFSQYSIEEAERAIEEMVSRGMMSEEDACNAREEVEKAKEELKKEEEESEK